MVRQLATAIVVSAVALAACGNPQPSSQSAPRQATPRVIPEPGTARGATQHYSGNGPASLGDFTVRSERLAHWKTTGDRFQLQYLTPAGPSSIGRFAGPSGTLAGEFSTPPGIYRHVKILTDGRWTLTIGPPPPGASAHG